MIHWAWLIAAFYGGVVFSFVMMALLSANDRHYPAPRRGADPEEPRVASSGGNREAEETSTLY